MDGPAPRGRLIASRDLLRLRFVGDVQLSPDGERVAWVERWIDPETDTYRSHILVAPADGSAPPRPFTAGTAQDKAPRWSPDGRWLAFLSNRPLPGAPRAGRDSAGSERSAKAPFQLYVMPAAGGEARPLTRLEYGAGSPLWSPDGTRIAFVAEVDPSAGIERLHDDDPAEKDPYRRFNRDVRIITRLRYKEDGVGFFDGRRRHLMLLGLPEAGGPAGDGQGEPVLVTCGQFDVVGADWMPDGRALLVVANLDPDADYQRWTDLYRVPVDAGRPEGPFERLTGGDVRITEARLAPDGRRVAFTGYDLEYDQYSNHHLFVLELGEPGAPRPRCLTREADLTVGNAVLHDVAIEAGTTLAWAPDGRAVYARVSQRGAVQLFRFMVGGGDAPDPRLVALTRGPHVVHDFSLREACGKAALVVIDDTSPGDVWVAPLGAAGLGELRRISRTNDAWLAEVELSRPEPFTFDSQGVAVDAWVMRPARMEPGRRYPAVVQIHGGPMAMYGHAFFFEFQLLAARGYAVLYCNPRGSQGYGQAFCATIRGDWGNEDFRDVMGLVDAALGRFPFIDPQRLGVAGGSYGGFMANWIVGHTDRFRAAVTMRSVANEYSFFGTSDIGYRDLYDFREPPWRKPEPYLRMSPLQYAGQMRTPMLILHAQDDLRCPVEQAEQLYVALKVQRVPVEFVRFPGESHGLSRSGRPWHRVFRLDRIVEWFDRYLPGGEPPPAA